MPKSSTLNSDVVQYSANHAVNVTIQGLSLLTGSTARYGAVRYVPVDVPVRYGAVRYVPGDVYLGTVRYGIEGTVGTVC